MPGVNVDNSIPARLRRRAHANPSAHLMLEAAAKLEEAEGKLIDKARIILALHDTISDLRDEIDRLEKSARKAA